MTLEQNGIHLMDIEDEMRKSYIDYAMSVIVTRALPDVRDGLKPVHRRILYSMHELGLVAEKPHRKSARIVGDVLGKYHPHGDSAVYDAMVRMAQDFSIRYMLVDGHGNFGSVDGDGAAAMRYTEARMSKIASELLRDINKNIIDYRPNFDETLQEPVVLPSRYPNLLVNGSSGIAVGMATNIPPHNLGEVIDGTIMVIDNPEIDLNDLLSVIKGPDFPTGGLIVGREGIKSAYRTGRGRVIVRAKASIEPMTPTKQRIIVTEIPYQVNKARLIEKIADLVRDKKIEGISDLRDESDRTGMRIVIELKRDVNANIILNQLYKHTQMQETFGVINLALVDGRPKVLNLKEILTHYIAHQKDVIIRRTQFDLNKAEERAHILEGLRIALDNIDRIIAIIRGAKNEQIAKDELMSQFSLSEKQAQAILDMRLRRLTGLERDKIEEEYAQLVALIQKLRDILGDDNLVYKIIKDELTEIKLKYNDERRTEITVDFSNEIEIEDLIQEEDVAITLTHYGYVKRLPATTYKAQKRGGKGIVGLTTKDEDFVEHLFITSTHHHLLFFTNMGKMYKLKGYEIPEAGRQARGTAIVNLLNLDPNEKIAAIIPIKEFTKDNYLVFATKDGIIKKTGITEYDTHRKNGLIAINLRENDELMSVMNTNGSHEIIVVTHNGMSIRFKEDDVRDMGRGATGVKAIDLNSEDYVIGAELIDENKKLLCVSEHGFGKKTEFEEYRLQSRGGKGIITYNVTEKTGNLIAIKVVDNEDDIMLITKDGTIIRTNTEGISTMGRNTQGVTLMKLDEGDQIVSLAKLPKEDEE